MIKNAKFSGYYFDMNLNIWGDFQICISVPLTKYFYVELEQKMELEPFLYIKNSFLTLNAT